MGNPKCPECKSCCDLVYFGPKRFWHCWLCDIWYDGINSDLFVVSKEEMSKYLTPEIIAQVNSPN